MDERNVINPISLSEFPSLNANKKKKEETYWHTGVSVTFERIAKRWLYVG